MLKTGTFILAATFAVALAAPADARVRQVQGSVQTQHGTYHGQATTTRQPGQRTRSATVVGPNGGQTSVYDNRSWGDGAYSHDRTRNFANGDTRTVDADATRIDQGVWAYDRSVTGRNGETRTQSGTVTIEPNN
ncbi:MAG: hypothetical protein NW206_07870 [Hyphomonadaceae bacterium]|nr:hypothetical protein [Hyphomonadaceae bacterium]